MYERGHDVPYDEIAFRYWKGLENLEKGSKVFIFNTSAFYQVDGLTCEKNRIPEVIHYLKIGELHKLERDSNFPDNI